MFWSDEEETMKGAPAAPVPTQDAVQNVLDDIEEQDETQELEEQMTEVEKRLEVAQYYKLLLTQHLFTDDFSDAAVSVQKEIRNFIRGRLEILLGLKAEQQRVVEPPLFSKEETLALKAVAAKIIQKPSVIEPKAQKQKAEPTLNKVDTATLKNPVKVEVKPEIQKTLNPVKGPGRPKKKVETKPEQKQSAQMASNNPNIVKKDGRVYKKTMGRGLDGNPKEILMDITPQAKPSGGIVPIPTPGKAQTEAIMENQARTETTQFGQSSQLVSIAISKAVE